MARVSGKTDASELLVQVGFAIRRERKAREISQEALAHTAGIDRSHMGKIERGERNLSLLNMTRIAAALEMLPSELLRSAGH